MMNDKGINKIVVSNKIPFGKQDFKYFIGYKDSKKIKSLSILRLRMGMYKRDFLIKVENALIIIMKLGKQQYCQK